MKSSISALWSWLGTSATSKGRTEGSAAPKERTSGRRKQAHPMLDGLVRPNSNRVAPTATPARHPVSPRVPPADELREAIAAVRAGADWAPGASSRRTDGRSFQSAPTARTDHELREAIAAVRAGSVWSPGASSPSSPRAASYAMTGNKGGETSSAAPKGKAL